MKTETNPLLTNQITNQTGYNSFGESISLSESPKTQQTLSMIQIFYHAMKLIKKDFLQDLHTNTWKTLHSLGMSAVAIGAVGAFFGFLYNAFVDDMIRHDKGGLDRLVDDMLKASLLFFLFIMMIQLRRSYTRAKQDLYLSFSHSDGNETSIEKINEQTPEVKFT